MSMGRTFRSLAAGISLGLFGLAGAASAQTVEERVNAAGSAASVQVLQNGSPVSTSRVTELGAMVDNNGKVFYHVALQPQGSSGELAYEASLGSALPDKAPGALRQTTGLLEGEYVQAPTGASGLGLQLTVDGLKVNTLDPSSPNASHAATGPLTSFGSDRLRAFNTGMTYEQSLLGMSALRSARGDFRYQGQPCSHVERKFVLDDGSVLKLRLTPTCAGLSDAGTLELLLTTPTYAAGRPISTTLARGSSTINPTIDSTVLFPVIGDTQYAQGDQDVQVFDYSGGTQSIVLDVAKLNGQTGPTACVPSDTTLCIDQHPGDKRFKIEVGYQTVQGGGLSGSGHAIPLSSHGVSQGGLFWFFNRTNPEMLVKILDANTHFWIFYSAGTNVGLTTTITDTFTGNSRVYTNDDRHTALPVQDTSAFSANGTPGPAYIPIPVSFNYDRDFSQSSVPPSTCVANDTTLCIRDRFKINIAYQTVQGGGLAGDGFAIPLNSDGVSDGGLFWFFGLGNPEMLVKVLDACDLNGKQWVFFSAGTNVGYTLTVEDTAQGIRNVYRNPDRSAAPPVLDTIIGIPCNTQSVANVFHPGTVFSGTDPNLLYAVPRTVPFFEKAGPALQTPYVAPLQPPM
jgi:hypothetical protein